MRVVLSEGRLATPRRAAPLSGTTRWASQCHDQRNQFYFYYSTAKIFINTQSRLRGNGGQGIIRQTVIAHAVYLPHTHTPRAVPALCMRHTYPLAHFHRALYAFAWVACLLAVSVLVALLLLYLLAPSLGDLGHLAWSAFAFLSGILLLPRPAVLPILHLVRSFAAGKRPWRAPLSLLLYFLGSALALMVYGIFAGALGRAVDAFLPGLRAGAAPWTLLFSGILLYAFSLHEVGLLRLFIPSYAGKLPAVIERAGLAGKAFFAGGFLGNIGVGAAHPALLSLFLAAVVSGDALFGATLFALHALGRAAVPLVLALAEHFGGGWIGAALAMKRALERVFAGATLFLASLLIVLAVFSSGWFVASGLADALLGSVAPSMAPMLEGALRDPAFVFAPTLFGQPISWGSPVFLVLVALPLLLHYLRERRRVLGDPLLELRRIERLEEMLEEERRGLEALLHIPDGTHGARYRSIVRKIEALQKDRHVIESSIRYGLGGAVRTPETQRYEEEILRLRRNWYLAIVATLAALLLFYLPALHAAQDTETPSVRATEEGR